MKMKTNLLCLFLFSLLFVGCSDDDSSDDDNGNDKKETYKVRYVAFCDSEDIVIKITYNFKNATPNNVASAIKEVVGSFPTNAPFSVELEMKYGEYCQINTLPNIDESTGTIDPNVTYTVAIYVDNVKVEEKSNKGGTTASYILIE